RPTPTLPCSLPPPRRSPLLPYTTLFRSQQAITSIPGSPVIGLAASSALLSGITGSASGAIGIVMNTLAPDYIAMGIKPELVHRITVIAAATLTAMPHSGVVITFNNLTGLSIRSEEHTSELK